MSPQSIFLWPAEQARPDPDAYVPPSGDWWAQYQRSLTSLVVKGELSPAAIQEIAQTSRTLVGLLPNPLRWDRPSPWKGIVVGSVQSGKTQSMMGVSAVALDAGYRLIIVLAGLRDDLRTQTARRFNSKLLLRNDDVPGVRGVTTLGGSLGPQGRAVAFASPYPRDCTDDAALPVTLPKALWRKLPAILVVKKTPTSLARVKSLLAGVYGQFGVESVPTLILDDECDEASVPGGAGVEKAVPEGITSLWESMPSLPRVAYLGYTATAAANLLANSTWPLYPNFVSLLRSPGAATSDLEYLEPSSDNWYSGGECFYEAFGEEPGEASNFLIRATISDEDHSSSPEQNASLADAFRAFFVSGAYRLELQPGRGFGSGLGTPLPHSMMIHTSPAQDDHSTWLAGVLRRYGVHTFADQVRGFDAAKLAAILSSEENAWRNWYDSFRHSVTRIYDMRPHPAPYRNVAWERVKARLPEVFENVRVKVVNSDEGESLDYEPSIAPNGQERPPRDVYLVAIGGSRLSRGITVKGLGISYFARWSVQRFEDTLLQMSRWLGYRGPYLEFCRLFLSRRAYDGFREMHENDARLRRRLACLMHERQSPEYATLVFRASPDVRPTAKLGAGKVRNLSFSPFVHVFSDVRYGDRESLNQQWALDLVSRIRARLPEPAVTQEGTQRGILSRNWTALEVADVLDGLSFQHHNPDSPLDLHEGRYRKPDLSRPRKDLLSPEDDPYQLAAYLRFWAEESPKGSQPPKFNVGVSWGSITKETAPFDFPLLDRQVTDNGRVQGAWTGRSGGWPGDYYFDRIPAQLKASGTSRIEGAPGLLLLYVIHKSAVGRSGTGITRASHTPFLGVSVPEGGPLMMRVVKEGKGE